jgi:uracil-DNA glycosylase
MILTNLWNLFENKVFPVHSTDTLFNQYNDTDLNVDLPNADKIRRKNLRSYLMSFPKRPSIVVIGEAPGPRGCRFSGVPFTSEAQLCKGILPFKGLQSSINDTPYSENTATIFWKVMLHHFPKFFMWNCVSYHPHKPGEILSIRNPTKNEIVIYSKLLSEILLLIKPKHLVAVGRSAEFALNEIGFPYIYVRHPSCGGAKDFRTSIERIFSEV